MVGAYSGIILKPVEKYRRGRSRAPKTETASASVSRSQSLQALPEVRSSRSPAPSSDRNNNNREISHLKTPQPSTQEEAPPRPNLAGTMALASGKSLGKLLSVTTKGILVDYPVAAAEGFHALPRLWGDEVPDYGTVTGVGSGFAVAGKSFAVGIGHGFRDLARQPAEGMAKEGGWGAVKGVAKGSASLFSKTIAGSVGLLAYPGLGIAKSLWAVTHGETGVVVAVARRVEGDWRAGRMSARVKHAVLEAYYQANVGGAV